MQQITSSAVFVYVEWNGILTIQKIASFHYLLHLHLHLYVENFAGHRPIGLGGFVVVACRRETKASRPWMIAQNYQSSYEFEHMLLWSCINGNFLIGDVLGDSLKTKEIAGQEGTLA